MGLVFSSRGATCCVMGGFTGVCACMLLPHRGSVVADDKLLLQPGVSCCGNGVCAGSSQLELQIRCLQAK